MYGDRIRRFKTEKETGTEMRPEIVSGIVTGDATVSYWPFFSCPWQHIQKSLQKFIRPNLPLVFKVQFAVKATNLFPWTCDAQNAKL